MEVSAIQNLIIDGLKICGMSTGNIQLASLMVLVSSEETQREVAEYLDRIVDNPPDEETIMDKVRQITTPK